MKKLDKFKINILTIIIGFSVMTGITTIVTILWTSLEIFFYGEVQHRIVDDIIATILVVSLLFNLKAALNNNYENED